MIIDDSIEEKPYTDENEIVCWHYDHSKDRLVKGTNFMTALYHSQGISLPVGFTLIAKTEHSVDKKDGKTKRRSPVTKNEYACQMLQQAVRKVALSLEEKLQGKYIPVDTLVFEDSTPKEVYLQGVSFPLLLVKQVFTNDDSSTGVLYLVTSNTTLTFDDLTTSYQKRWNVERYQQSLKQNASAQKSPTQTVTTQTNHFFVALCAFVNARIAE